MIDRVLRTYKRWLSPMFPPACRYVPSCSEYAAEAVARYGILRGGLMAAWRFVRCNPLSRGGHDPVCRAKGNDIFVRTSGKDPRYANPA